MRGSIIKRGGSYALVFDVTDGATGLKKQKWHTFRPTGKTEGERKEQCESKLTELLHGLDTGEYVEASQMTFGHLLQNVYFKKYVEPALRPRSRKTYLHIITKWLVPNLGAIRVQALRASDLRRYYAHAAKTLGPASVRMHHAIISAALRVAAHPEERLVPRNVAAEMESKPKPPAAHSGVDGNTWTREEAQAFLVEASKLGPQCAAFYRLALDSGMRKSELAGLRWKDVDLDKRKITVMQQLVSLNGDKPEFGPTKTGKPRTIDVGEQTARLLLTHRQHQNQIKIANAGAYVKLREPLVFAREPEHLTTKADKLGLPLKLNNIGTGEMGRLIKAADVRRITCHGMRHTCASLLFQNGTNVKAIQERLGHSKVEMTLAIYTHLTATAQKDAAEQLNALLG